MQGSLVVRRSWLWGGLGVALGIGVVLYAGRPGRARATEESEAGHRSDETVATAKALVTQLEGRLRSTESSLKKARELLAELEGNGPARQPGPGQATDAGGDDTNLLEGVWRIVGIGGHQGGEFRKPPYDEYKIMTAGHYLWLSFNPETGEVVRSGGGVYSLKDGTYTARIECSNSDDLKAIIGQEYKGTCKIEGKRWYHVGRVPNGAGFDELWERVH